MGLAPWLTEISAFLLSHRPMLAVPALQHRFGLGPVRQGLGQFSPEGGGVIAVLQVRQLVGYDVFHGYLGGLDESPVDADDAVFPAGPPGVFGVGQACAFGLYVELGGVLAGEVLEVPVGSVFEPFVECGLDGHMFGGPLEPLGYDHVEFALAGDRHLIHRRALHIQHEPTAPVLELGPACVVLGELLALFGGHFPRRIKHPPPLGLDEGGDAAVAAQGCPRGHHHLHVVRRHHDALVPRTVGVADRVGDLGLAYSEDAVHAGDDLPCPTRGFRVPPIQM